MERHSIRLTSFVLMSMLGAMLLASALLFIPAPRVRASGTTWHVTKLADTNDGVCNGDCSLREAIGSTANGDTIDFPSLSGTIVLSSTLGELFVSNNITITGPGAANLTVSGNNAVRVFDIGGNVTMMGLTIRNGKAPSSSGGGIYVSADTYTLKLSNVGVLSNTAQYGAGIYNNGGILVFDSLTVTNNLATSAGGGINNNNNSGPTSLTLSNSLISGNLVNGCCGGGGGILSGGPVTITNSSILSNTVLCGNGCGNGGGIAKLSNSTMQLTNVTVSGNVVYGIDNYGGGIYNASTSMLNMTGGVVFSNTVIDSGSLGGGIFSTGISTATISGTLVLSNTAGFGGGIAGGNFTSINVLNAIVISNTAHYGGGISNLPNGFLTVSGSTIQGNTATEYGGGIENNGPFTLTNTTLNANRTTGSSLGGSGIFNSSAMTVTNSTISANQSSTSGGGIYNYNTATVTLNFVTIANNSANYGGGIANNGTFTTSNSLIAGNSASVDSPDCGGVIASGGYNLIGNDTSCDVSSVTSDQVGTGGNPIYPRFTSLAYWGGSTQTHGLLFGSPALDKIPNGTNGCGTLISQDQRGSSRPKNGTCDIGAFEGMLYQLFLPLINR